jgi:CBS domain-containing membrane protein
MDFSRRKALFCLLHGMLAVVTAGALSLVTGTPILFPAYGATAFILMVMPNGLPAAPRSVVLGHCIGATVGWSSAHACNIDFAQATLMHGGSWQHVAAAAIALGVASALMLVARAPHPPAGATTLIFALGQLTPAYDIAIVTGSVAILCLQMGAVYRFANVPYPLWSATRAPAPNPNA